MLIFWPSIQLMLKKTPKPNCLLEPVCCKKQQKKVPDQLHTGLWNRGPQKILNVIKLMLDDQGNHLGLIYVQSVWNHSGPSEVPYSANQYITGQELFLLFLTANRL